MNISKIEENIQQLVKSPSQEEFIYGLLLAYGLPKASITRLKDGAYNLSKKKGTILWKKKLLFQEVFDQDLHACIDQLRRNEDAIKHSPRFVIVTDYETLLAYDTKTKDTLDTKLKDLAKYFDFFLPWSGREKAQAKLENPADVKAAEKMAKLYDNIRQDNPHQFHDYKSLHELNVFLSRLLFCFFAEDTEIFPKKLFVNSIASHTQPDGSDLSEYLERLFEVLNTKHSDRKGFPEYLKKFEYVNGGLFSDSYTAPKFTPRSRKMLIECGELDWSEINPDIFGSMIQAVVHPDQRGGMGMHYTSVSNIMKVIEPLFLNELNEEFENNQHNPQKLDKLLGRLSTIRIFDPACGSGNFLIIAYKELRLLEIKILKQLKALSEGTSELDDVQASLIPKAQMSLASTYVPQLFSRVDLSQFYGIELDDFAHEIAILSLWLAEHQMNVKFNEAFQKKLPSLPLKQGGKIICDNATRLDWEKVCTKDKDSEVYILGNPPYLGFNVLSAEQRKDIEFVLPELDNLKFLDYITCWFIKAARYTKGNCRFAFVTTNSICQGVQVPIVWPHIFNQNLEINFAHSEFAWSNNAKKNAGVICSVIGLRPISNKPKYFYENTTKIEVKNINAYLVNGGNIIVEKRQTPLSNLPKISTGNIPYDGGNLILTSEEAKSLLLNYPQSREFIKELSGSVEFIRGITRYCLWIEDNQVVLARSIAPIQARIEAVKKSREQAGKIAKNYAHVPHKFYMTNRAKESQIIIPRVSSVRRKYIPMGFLKSDVIISDSAQAIYDPETWVFAVITSYMHMVWVKAIGGKLKSDYRYSAVICYNTFPVPDLSSQQKATLTTHVLNVLEEREAHSEKTMAELYDPEKMPKSLRDAHAGLDEAVERCYRIKPFTSDEERLEYLFKLYEEMTVAGNRRAANE